MFNLTLIEIMPLYVYEVRGSNMVRRNERDWSLLFASILRDEFKDSEDICLFIHNYCLRTHKMGLLVVDGILITPRCITVIDFRDFSGYIKARINGNWLFRKNETDEWDANVLRCGSVGRNIIEQVSKNHDALVEFLNENEVKIASKAFYAVSGIIAFKEIKGSENDGFGSIYKIGICDSSTFKDLLKTISSKHPFLTNDEIRKIRSVLDIESELLDESKYKDYQSSRN